MNVLKFFFIGLIFIASLPCFSREINVHPSRIVIAGRSFAEEEVAVCSYDDKGEPTSNVRKCYKVLLPLDQNFKESFITVLYCLHYGAFEECVISGNGDMTHQKLCAYVNDLNNLSTANLFKIGSSNMDKLSSTINFLVRRALEIVLINLKHNLPRQGFSPTAHEFISRREFEDELKNLKDAEGMFQLYLKLVRTAKNYAAKPFDEDFGDINVAVQRILEDNWCKQLDAKLDTWSKPEREKYANYMSQYRQNQNQLNAQLLQLMMMNHQQNMNVNSEVNQLMRSAGSTPVPKVESAKGYCARHNCSYELTQGCHFCSAPNFGDTNPWRIRGNWDGEIR